MSTTTHSEQVVNHQSKSSKAQARLAWILISPTVLVLTIVILIPIAQSLYQSLFGRPRLEDNGFFSTIEPFVGLKNYTDIFSSAGERFWVAFYNTTLFGVVTVVLETVLGVAMALIMHKAMKGRGIVRASILVPWAIPTAVSAILWGWIFNQNGVANAILGRHVMWASGDLSAKAAIIIADVWKTAPYIGLLTLAGLQLIPDEVYEAAKIDGTTGWQRFFKVVFPMISPTVFFCTIMTVIGAFKVFAQPYMLTKGGPGEATNTIVLALYRNGFSFDKLGYASSMAWVLFVIVMTVTALQFAGQKKWVNYDA